MEWKEIEKKLKTPMPCKEKVQAISKDKTKELWVSYIDARDVMQRLDEVIGVENWSATYRVINFDASVVECSLTIHNRTKTDVGYPNGDEDEPLKSAYSDSLKRAGVQWGIGRFLYDLPKTWRPSGEKPEPGKKQVQGIPTGKRKILDALAKSKGIDPVKLDKLAQEYSDGKVGGVSEIQDLTGFIDYIKQI